MALSLTRPMQVLKCKSDFLPVPPLRVHLPMNAPGRETRSVLVRQWTVCCGHCSKVHSAATVDSAVVNGSPGH